MSYQYTFDFDKVPDADEFLEEEMILFLRDNPSVKPREPSIFELLVAIPTVATKVIKQLGLGNVAAFLPSLLPPAPSAPSYPSSVRYAGP